MSEGTLFCETSCSVWHYFRRAPGEAVTPKRTNMQTQIAFGDGTASLRRRQKSNGRTSSARQVMEFPLEFVPNKSFEAWSRDQKTENEVLGSMPTCGESSCKAEPPYGTSPYFAGICQFALLTREQEVHLFRKMNYLKYKASELRRRLNSVRPKRR